VGVFGHDAREKRDSLEMQLMRNSENRNGNDRRVREYHFVDTFGRGISIVCSLNVRGKPHTEVGQFSKEFQSFFFRSLLAVRANDRRLRTSRSDAPINLHGEPFIDGIHQPGNMVFDVRGFDELAAEVAGKNDFQEIVKQFDDQGLVWKWRWSKVLEFRRQIAERTQYFTGDCRNFGSIP
jgi:hypothetical protein